MIFLTSTKDVYPKTPTPAQERRLSDPKGTQYSDNYGEQLLCVWLISSKERRAQKESPLLRGLSALQTAAQRKKPANNSHSLSQEIKTDDAIPEIAVAKSHSKKFATLLTENLAFALHICTRLSSNSASKSVS
jgi:hypothetical protein